MDNSSGSPPISTPEVTPSEDSARIPVSVLDTDAFVTEYFSPKPNLTPKDLKASHWVVDWNELESRATGPVFEVGGHKWNILFFPQGNNPSDGCSSFFLQYTNAEQEPEGWGVCAEFCLVISNVDHPDVFSLNRK
ncbi:ubiquitin-specific protease ubp15 [Spiromyces aspiralis]|uniref:Ubiquitin-specific protease ubp15 n=1 Tax=Spiromyces aspiralis TaxID=68401 RepID=A0ACC1HE03_9FUNG|nr:ubiquitin-specific protease ubp15 [Spiromyces aspiralis]